MSSKRKDYIIANTAFMVQLKQALEHFNDPTWLGEHSPLAAPYFLGEHFLKRPDIEITDATERGLVLQKLLAEATTALRELDREGDREGRLLELEYHFHKPKLSRRAMYEALNISRAQLYRDLDERLPRAMEKLAELFIQKTNPALRLEFPIQRPIVGRKTEIAECRDVLTKKQTVGLSGLGGVGKTALGSYLALSLAQPPFWFTIQIGLNDQLSNIFFALGYYLQHQLAWQDENSGLFAQLTAEQHQKNSTEILLGLLRRDMATLDGFTLYCFDEVDLLRPTEVEAHAQILTFLETISQLEQPILFMGQQLPLAPDHHVVLTGLSTENIAELLQQQNITATAAELAQLQRYTQGNPRLLELLIALYQTDPEEERTLAGVLAEFPQNPSVEVLLNRVWRRLSAVEEQLLTELAVFRQAVPREAWSAEEERAAMDTLLQRHLIQVDLHGGVMVLPAFQALIYGRLPLENRQRLHLKAADIRASYGEYTAAAYHFVRGDQPEQAVWLWYPQRTQEINQGRAEAALQIFENVSLKQLKKADRELLTIIRAELYTFLGDYDKTMQSLRLTFRHSPVLKALAKRLEGDTVELQGRYEQARRAYQESLNSITHLLSMLPVGHKKMSWVYYLDHNLDKAWHEAQLAGYEANYIQGRMQMVRGEYEEATNYLQQALAQAEQMGHEEGRAKSHLVLAEIYSDNRQFAEMKFHMNEALTIYQKTGHQTKIAAVLADQAMFYNQAGEPELAIEAGRKALEILESLGESRNRAAAAQNLAEAYQALGQLEEAEQHAWMVIHTEEQEHLPDGLRVLGEVQLARGRVAEAQRYVQQSIDFAQQNQNRFLEAYAWRAMGHVQQQQAEDDDAAASDAFAQAITLFSELGLTGEAEITQQQRERVCNVKSMA